MSLSIFLTMPENENVSGMRERSNVSFRKENRNGPLPHGKVHLLQDADQDDGGAHDLLLLLPLRAHPLLLEYNDWNS